MAQAWFYIPLHKPHTENHIGPYLDKLLSFKYCEEGRQMEVKGCCAVRYRPTIRIRVEEKTCYQQTKYLYCCSLKCPLDWLHTHVSDRTAQVSAQSR